MSKYTYIGFLSILFLLTACKKEQMSQYSTIDEYMAQYAAPEQIFVVNGLVGGAINTSNNRIATFKPKSFEYLGGSGKFLGDVTVRVQEFSRKSDFLFSQISTQAADQTPLRARTAIRMRFHDYSNQQIVTNDSLTRIFFPDVMYENSVYTYAGEVQPYNRGLLWTNGFPNFTTPVALNGGTELNIPGIFEWQSLADTLITEYVTLDFQMVNYKPSNGRLFIVIDDEFTVLRVQTPSNLFTFDKYPKGKKGHIVAMAIRDGNLYGAVRTIEVSTNENMYVTLTQYNGEDLYREIRALD
jgi:hypothetical protein